MFETDPADESAEEPRVFVELLIDVENATVHQSKVAGIARQRHVGDLAHQPIKKIRRRPLENGLAPAFLADAENHLIAFAPLCDERRDQVGRVLQVRVDHDGGFPAGMPQTGRRRHFVTEVAR